MALRHVLAVVALVSSPVVGASLPKYLTWRQLQAREVESHPGCKCARSNGLQGLVRNLGGELCLPTDRKDIEGLTAVNSSVCYDHDYGTGECRMWDAGRGACATESPEPWCFHFWCWIDPNECKMGDIHTSFFFDAAIQGIGGSSPSFSYMTCGTLAEDNPYFSLWVPPHITAVCTFVGLAVPLVAFLALRRICYYVPAASGITLPWLMVWTSIIAKKIINWLSLETRVPNFPSSGTTDSIMDSVALFFLLLCVSLVLDMLDGALREAKYQRHKEQQDSKSVQILESVLLYNDLSQKNWADHLQAPWRHLYGFSKVAMGLIWVFTVLKLPLLSDLLSGSLVGTFFIFGLGGIFGFKDDVFAAIHLAMVRPFKVADIISVHTCSNHEGAMSAICVGFVERLGLLHIHIRNFDMRLQVVPTHVFAKGTIKNWSARQYKTSEWRLWLSMHSPPQSIKAFRENAERILRSHPACKTDGYIKVCVTRLGDGGFETIIICFTRPKSDHHAFKLEYSMALSTLCSRLGLYFVWPNLSREDVNEGEMKDKVERAGGPAVSGTNDFDDLLFHGRHTKGVLFSKLKQRRAVKLSRGFEQAATEAELVIDMLFGVPLSHPIVVGDREIQWTDEHPQVTGSLSVLVDCGTLQAILPKAPVFGATGRLSIVAMVAKRRKTPAEEGALAVVDRVQPEGLASLQALHRAGDEVLAICRGTPRHYSIEGHITWDETLDLGEVPLERPASEDAVGALWLQLVVCRGEGDQPVELLGAVEQPLLGLVQGGWKDQQVKVSMKRGNTDNGI